MDLLKDFFNPYERTARLYPALIILAPTFMTIFCLFEELRDILSSIIGSIFFVSTAYYLGKISREIGKKKQEGLIVLWDGMPSTRFLRHRDTSIDSISKERYHQFLQTHVSNLTIPTPEEELNDQESADIVYDSAIKWLLVKTRDTQKYSLLFRENISYGFTRNFWALKPLGITINFLVLLGTVTLVYKRYHFDFNLIPNEILFSVAFTLIIITFILFISKKTIHSKAKAYARTLLEVCDENNN